jgi:amidase
VLVHPSFDGDRLEPWTLALSRWCEREPRPLAGATRRLRALAAQHASITERCDVLLSPVVAHPPPLLGHLATDAPFEVAMERIRAHCPFTGIANAAGVPALSLPLGRTEGGLPIGVQLAGRAWDESTLLALALDLERARPWPQVARAGG